jgi:enoyl-CoA hydratase/carnithine racemase
MVEYTSAYDPESAPRDLQFVRYEKRDHIAYVTIDRPEVRNALHSYSYVELRRCRPRCRRRSRDHAGCPASSGAAFCAGRDVKFLARYQEQGIRTPHEDPNSDIFYWGGGGMPDDAGLEKPLIAAVQGFAVGVGLTLALQCQLRVMAEDAWLGDQHTNVGRLGAPQNKYTAMPRATAAYLTLCNGRLTAQDCLTQGIVNRVVPEADLMAAAEDLARMVCRSSPRAVQASVRLYRLSAAQPELSAYAKHLDKEIAESADGAEGPRAFREKRAPVWSER